MMRYRKEDAEMSQDHFHGTAIKVVCGFTKI